MPVGRVDGSAWEGAGTSHRAAPLKGVPGASLQSPGVCCIADPGPWCSATLLLTAISLEEPQALVDQKCSGNLLGLASGRSGPRAMGGSRFPGRARSLQLGFLRGTVFGALWTRPWRAEGTQKRTFTVLPEITLGRPEAE